MVIEVLTAPSGMPSNRSSMSRTESIATPTWPTSPTLRGSSLSSPIWVGRSKAAESPGCPWASRYLKRALASAAVP